jgi:hypothetical protein
MLIPHGSFDIFMAPLSSSPPPDCRYCLGPSSVIVGLPELTSKRARRKLPTTRKICSPWSNLMFQAFEQHQITLQRFWSRVKKPTTIARDGQAV